MLPISRLGPWLHFFEDGVFGILPGTGRAIFAERSILPEVLAEFSLDGIALQTIRHQETIGSVSVLMGWRHLVPCMTNLR